MTSQSTLEPLARKLGYRVKLDQNDREALLALPHVVRMVERNHFLVREYERATHSALMLSGYSIRVKNVVNGGRQILSIHMGGDIVDLQNSLLEVADHSVQMLTAGKVAMIPRQAIVDLTLARPRIAHAMWLDTLVDGSIFREWLANVGRRDARTRIAHLQCEFALRLRIAGSGKQNGYELPMTQEQLADATGLTSVHVNRTIKSLEADGLIEPPKSAFDHHRQLAKACRGGRLRQQLSAPARGRTGSRLTARWAAAGDGAALSQIGTASEG